MGAYSDNFYSWLERQSKAGRAAMDAGPSDFDESKHPREGKGGEGGGRFKKSNSTIAKEDDLEPSRPSSKKGYREKRDALSNSIAEDGTYDLETGAPVDHHEKGGFQVSFQEETTERPGHDAYISDAEYDRKVEALSHELGDARPELGRFGEPEISFHVMSLDKALEVARRHNQESVFDWSTFQCIPNKDFVGQRHYADRDNHIGKHYHEHKPNPNA